MALTKKLISCHGKATSKKPIHLNGSSFWTEAFDLMHFNRNIYKSNLFKVNPWNIECFLCRLNYLSISHGNNSIDHYCGNLTGKVIFVSRDYLVLTFHSNEKFDPNNRGFEIFFTEDVNMPGKWMYYTISILL